MERATRTRSWLLTDLSWKPIPGCPGRLVHAGLSARPVEDVVGLATAPPVRTSAVARDPVVIVLLADGGVISYCKADGMYLHTLATPEAFARKVRQLGSSRCEAAHADECVAPGTRSDGRDCRGGANYRASIAQREGLCCHDRLAMRVGGIARPSP